MPPAASFFSRKNLPKEVPTSLDAAASGIEETLVGKGVKRSVRLGRGSRLAPCPFDARRAPWLTSAVQMALLRILNGSLESQEIELTPDAMTVGRASACNIRIADAGVSSKHAKIWCEDGQYFLMDLGSTNGTFVNERDVDREQINDGDVITFGMTKAAFVGDKPRVRPHASAARAPANQRVIIPP